MREEDIPGEEPMRGLFGKFLNPSDEIFVDMVAAELGDELVVVDLLSGGVLHLVWVYDQFRLLDLGGLICLCLDISGLLVLCMLLTHGFVIMGLH